MTILASILLFIKGIVIGLAVSVPMGPIGVICVQRTINKGRVYGLISGFGAALADTIFAIIAIFSLSMSKTFFTQYTLELQIIGIVALLFLGTKIFFTNPITQVRRRAKGQKHTMFSDFISVFFLTLSNPLTVIFFGAAIAALGFNDNGNYVTSQIIIIGGISTGATAWWITLTHLVNTFRHKFRLKQLWWINKISGSVILGLTIITSIILIIKNFSHLFG